MQSDSHVRRLRDAARRARSMIGLRFKKRSIDRARCCIRAVALPIRSHSEETEEFAGRNLLSRYSVLCCSDWETIEYMERRRSFDARRLIPQPKCVGNSGAKANRNC